MKRNMWIVGIVAGCIFFGVAMGLRELFDSIWLRAGIAAIGGVGLGIVISLAYRNRTG